MALSAVMISAWYVSTVVLSRVDHPDLWSQILNDLYPDNKGVPKGDPSAREKLNADATVHDGSKCAKTLGVKYTTLEHSVKDMSESLKSRFNV